MLNTVKYCQKLHKKWNVIASLIFLGGLSWTPTPFLWRSQVGWIAFYKHKDSFLEKSIPIGLKRKLFDRYVLSLTYDSNTRSLTKKMDHKLQATQRSLERVMTRYRRDRKTNFWIREPSKVRGIIITAKFITTDNPMKLHGRWSMDTTDNQIATDP